MTNDSVKTMKWGRLTRGGWFWVEGKQVVFAVGLGCRIVEKKRYKRFDMQTSNEDRGCLGLKMIECAPKQPDVEGLLLHWEERKG